MNISYNIKITTQNTNNIDLISTLFQLQDIKNIKQNENTLVFENETENIKITKSQINTLLDYLKILSHLKDL